MIGRQTSGSNPLSQDKLFKLRSVEPVLAIVYTSVVYLWCADFRFRCCTLATYIVA